LCGKAKDVFRKIAGKNEFFDWDGFEAVVEKIR